MAIKIEDTGTVEYDTEKRKMENNFVNMRSSPLKIILNECFNTLVKSLVFIHLILFFMAYRKI